MPMNRLLVAGFGLAVCLVAPTLSLAQGGRDGGGGGGRGREGGGGNQPGQRGGGGGGMGGGGMMRGLMGGGGMGDPFSPAIDTRELEDMGKSLNLSAEQKEMARTLFDGYQEAFTVKAREMREKMDRMREEARESGDFSAFQQIGTVMADFRAATKKMEDQYFSDFKAVLTPEQEKQWPTVERERRREKTMNVGRLSGERMDLFRLVDQAKFPDEVKTSINPTLEQYAMDLDRELVSRNKVYEESMTRVGQIGMNFQENQGELQKMLERARDASVKVREVNRRYARQIEAQLPENLRADWDKAVKTASFPDVYRQSGASRQITAALGFSDLADDQKTSIEALNATYARELDAVNDKLAQATEKNEMTMSVERMIQRFGGGGGDNTDPTAEPRQQKRDLDSKTIDSLHKILTPEQQSRLPANDRGGRNFGGGGGQDGNRRGGGDGGDTPRRGRGGGGGG